MRAWTRAALCAQVGDPDMWFPGPGGSTRLAVDICNRCPVTAECEAAWQALPPELQRHGIWAGVTQPQRRERFQLTVSCPRCGKRIPPGPSRYCSQDCRAEAKREQSRRYQKARYAARGKRRGGAA